MRALLLEAWQDWSCPNCAVTDRTRPQPPNSARMHTCAGLHMLTAPLILAGSDCKVIAVERQDYLGREIQETGDDGRPYSGVQTIRADGSNDVAAFAPVAQGHFGGRE